MTQLLLRLYYHKNIYLQRQSFLVHTFIIVLLYYQIPILKIGRNKNEKELIIH